LSRGETELLATVGEQLGKANSIKDECFVFVVLVMFGFVAHSLITIVIRSWKQRVNQLDFVQCRDPMLRGLAFLCW
jgi:hypothetical protein